MRLAEVSVLGVYVSPLVPMLLAAWAATLVLQRLADRAGLLRRVWHPALFMFCTYLVVLAAIVLAVAG